MEKCRKPKEDGKFFVKFKENINELRTKKELFDIKLNVTVNGSEQSYVAHKFVLACASSYFKILILELEKARTDTLDLEPTYEDDYFSLILDYIYTSKIQCTVENVIGLYKYSEDFQLDTLRSVIIEFMETHVSLNTWLNYWRFSESKGIADISSQCRFFYTENWKDILEKYLNELSLEELSKIVTFKMKKKKNHTKLSKYIIRWTQINEKERIHDLYTLTGWNKYLNWDSILYLCENPNRGLKEYVNHMTYQDLYNLCDEESQTESDQKILFTCVTEWINQDRIIRESKFWELLVLIGLPEMEAEFVQRQISNEKLIYENPKIKKRLERAINYHKEPLWLQYMEMKMRKK